MLRTSRIDVPLLRKAVRAGPPTLVRRMLGKLGPTELALVLLELPPPEAKAIVTHLCADRPRLTLTIRAIPDELFAGVAAQLGEAVLARALGALDADDAVRVLLLLDEQEQQRVLTLAGDDLGLQLRRLLRYAPESAGRHMNPRFLAVSPQATVGEAIRAVRQAGADVPLFYLYVVEDDGQLVGVTSLGKLVKAADATLVSKIMEPDVIAVAAHADQEEVARVVSQRNLLAVPVVDEGRLLGVVTIDDVIGVLEREATEDMYNMAGLSEGDRVFSPPHRSLLKRLPWNMLNLVTSILAAIVVGLFEHTIAQLVVLATFMPVVAGIGGNTGNQTLTVIIRGITLGELEFSSGLRALLKEVMVGISVGIILGTVVGLVAFVWKGNAMLGLVIGCAIIANLFVAALVGTAIPLTLKRLGLDPALGGSILVTMCTDVFGFLSFLGLATLFMHYLL